MFRSSIHLQVVLDQSNYALEVVGGASAMKTAG